MPISNGRGRESRFVGSRRKRSTGRSRRRRNRKGRRGTSRVLTRKGGRSRSRSRRSGKGRRGTSVSGKRRRGRNRRSRSRRSSRTMGDGGGIGRGLFFFLGPSRGNSFTSSRVITQRLIFIPHNTSSKRQGRISSWLVVRFFHPPQRGGRVAFGERFMVLVKFLFPQTTLPTHKGTLLFHLVWGLLL